MTFFILEEFKGLSGVGRFMNWIRFYFRRRLGGFHDRFSKKNNLQFYDPVLRAGSVSDSHIVF